MPYNYAEQFQSQIEKQYARELTSADFYLNKGYKFINAEVIKIAALTVSGYKDHKRDGSKNRGKLENDWLIYKLRRDRDIEFYVDELDVDETNQVLTAANVTSAFNEDQAIPETDAYNYSTLYQDWVALGGVASTVSLTDLTILSEIDKGLLAMNKAGVPSTGRRMKVTPDVDLLIKNAKDLQRYLNVQGNASTSINRIVKELDNVQIDMVPGDRMMTVYDWSEGFVVGATAKQINFILYHNSAIIAADKIKDIYLWPKGSTPESAYGWLYQNRAHGDCFPVQKKMKGIYFHVEA